MKTRVLLVVFIAILSVNVWGQRKVYQSNPAKEVTDKLGVTLIESRAGFVYERESSNYLVPYIALKFRNNTKIEKKRYVGSLCYCIKKNGEIVYKNYMWGKEVHPGVNVFSFLVINSSFDKVPDNDCSGYTIECYFAESEDWKNNRTEKICFIGEFKPQKINYKLTYREDFVYYDGRFMQRIDVPFEKL